MDFGEVSRITTSRSTTRIRVADPKPRKKADPNLHDGSTFGMVYVNELGRKAYSKYGAPDFAVFPVGSILVREKLMRVNANKPQVLTVMIKREKGFNPEGGDWSFLAINGEGTKVHQRKKKGSCLECHQSASGRDFVFELK